MAADPQRNSHRGQQQFLPPADGSHLCTHSLLVVREDHFVPFGRRNLALLFSWVIFVCTVVTCVWVKPFLTETSVALV